MVLSVYIRWMKMFLETFIFHRKAISQVRLYNENISSLIVYSCVQVSFLL